MAKNQRVVEIRRSTGVMVTKPTERTLSWSGEDERGCAGTGIEDRCGRL